MSPFIIFALVLTTVYVIYFAATITYDLHAKDKTSNKSEEEFDVSNMATEEEATDIEEEFDSSSQPEYETKVSDDGLQIIGPKSDSSGQKNNNAEGHSLSSPELNEKGNEGTEEIASQYEFACTSPEFLNAINNKYQKTTQRKIEKENVRDNL